MLLLPGYTDSKDLTTLAAYLWQAGFHVHPFGPRPSDGSVLLRGYWPPSFRPTLTSPLARISPWIWWPLALGRIGEPLVRAETRRATRVRGIALATPHNGTLFAYLPVNGPGLRQMQPESAFLTELIGHISSLARINFTSIWTPLDLTVFPATSCLMDVGKMVRLMLPHHRALLSYRRCFAAVVEELRAPVDRF